MLQNILGLEWFKLVTITLEELVLHLDPVKSETMQEAFHLVHAHNHSKCNRPESWVHKETSKDCSTNTGRFVDTNIVLDDQVEEHFRKLTVSKRKSPESEVRSSVGDGSENKLNGFNQLVDECFSERMVMVWSTHFLKDCCDSSVSFLKGLLFYRNIAVILNSIVSWLTRRINLIIFFKDFIQIIWSVWVSETAWNNKQIKWNADKNNDQ